MRRPFAVVAGLAFALIAAPLAGQDSAQVIVQDTVQVMAQAPTPEAIARPGTPEWRRGTWGAQFGVGSGFYGIGALRFTGPDAAWLLRARVIATAEERDDYDYESEHRMLQLDLGRRWYGAARGRVRPYHSVAASFGHARSESGFFGDMNEQGNTTAGLLGEAGATIFFTPELSLGASWAGAVRHTWWWSSTNGGAPSRSRGFALDAGSLTLEGGFYF